MNTPKNNRVKDRLVKLWEKLVETCKFAEKHPLIGYLIQLLLALIEWWLSKH
ncbi:MAG: hypothetical protein K2N63_07250 [Lachnospiraceae bacterium]|nr:hypothetical protein [Lachnospiraceae bacterium]